MPRILSVNNATPALIQFTLGCKNLNFLFVFCAAHTLSKGSFTPCTKWQPSAHLLGIAFDASELVAQFAGDSLFGGTHGSVVLRHGGAPQRLCVRVVVQRV